jgi:hypothetical protein
MDMMIVRGFMNNPKSFPSVIELSAYNSGILKLLTD